MKTKLSTLIFVQGDRVLSPPLVTVREYGKWLESTYDEYTCNYELYLKSNVAGEKVLEFHPGTRIGKYFDSTSFSTNKYDSWYVYQESQIMEKIVRLKFARYNDIASTLSGDKKGLKLLRLYSTDQIELYVRTKIDRNFQIGDKFLEPKKIVVRKCDLKDIIMPEIKRSRKSLFEDRPIAMTVEDIEKQLGHKVSIIS